MKQQDTASIENIDESNKYDWSKFNDDDFIEIKATKMERFKFLFFRFEFFVKSFFIDQSILIPDCDFVDIKEPKPKWYHF